MTVIYICIWFVYKQMKGKTMTKDKKKCADLVHQKYQDTLKDYEDAYNYFNEDEDKRKPNEDYESYEDFFDYVNQSGLCFDFVSVDTFENQNRGYWRFKCLGEVLLMNLEFTQMIKIKLNTLNIGTWIGLMVLLFVSMMMLYIIFVKCF